MSGSFLFKFILIIVLIVFFICIFFSPFLLTSFSINMTYQNNILLDMSSDYSWPCPGYTRISSYFGYRKKPTSGASIYHSGIDIPAPHGSNIVAIFDGYIQYTGFKGADGFTIIIESNNFTAIYGHVSPNFKVYEGQLVKKGQIIGNVGPKIVYNVPNNPYFDNKGNQTNGATTRWTSSFHNKKR